MTTIHLDKLLSGHVFVFLLIFCRVGSILMLFPGLAESYVAPRLRMILALAISFVLMEPLLPRMPAAPEAMGAMALLVGHEVLVGVFFGTVLRLVVNAIETAGSVVSLQTGLSNATILNPALASQSPLASAFLGVAGVTLIFVTGLDHFFFLAIRALYEMFPPGGTIIISDMTQFIIQTVSHSFVVGVELATPFLVMGLLMYMAIGMMQRLMPQVQLFLVAVPVQIWGGLALLSLTVAGIMTFWLHYCDETVGALFGR
ncbi:MAG: flagellar biosynthetic protein FliR [Pseudomonadota bacterium]|nr:flagellar biosynthetic protein FliR [Pseudomonadota bacterium]